MTGRAHSLALSALVIWSAVLVGVGPSLIGPAEAQTDAQTHTFDGSQQGADKPRVVAVDVSNMTGTVIVEWSTGDTGHQTDLTEVHPDFSDTYPDSNS